MMTRHDRPRLAIACIAVLGVLETAYLTLAEFSGKAAEICPTQGCKEVLTSPYAQIFELPLTLFGFIAYVAVTIIAISPWLMGKQEASDRRSWEKTSWLWLLGITTSMAVSSGYLMYVMFFRIQALCPYCVVSALLSLSLFLLTTMAHRWSNRRQLVLIGLIAATISFTGVLSVYANVDSRAENPVIVAQAPPITTESGPAEIALANHLRSIDAKIYTAYTCPHCHEQKQLLGQEAVNIINDIECHPQGENAKPQLCEAAGIRGVPTWEINGEFYPGVQPLETLADLSGYTGSREFIHPFPY